jgi:hypothetical protein
MTRKFELTADEIVELFRAGEEGGGYNTLVRAILETAGLDEDAKKALIEALKDWYV